jgi:hypothetical protein
MFWLLAPLLKPLLGFFTALLDPRMLLVAAALVAAQLLGVPVASTLTTHLVDPVVSGATSFLSDWLADSLIPW